MRILSTTSALRTHYAVFQIEIEELRSFETHIDLKRPVAFAGDNVIELPDSSHSDFPINRFDALEEVQGFLEYKRIELSRVFEVLHCTSDGYLIFNFRGVVIEFSRGFERCANSNAVHLSIVLNNKLEKSVDYEYDIKDLTLLNKKKQMRQKSARVH